MSAPTGIAYAFAVPRAVPHVHLGEFVPIGVIVHARTVEFLGLRVITDPGVLRARLPGMDHELLAHYLQTYQALCAGDPSAGPLALAPPSERFHWLTAPRSDVVQTSPIHEGICDHPELALDILFATYVAGG